MNDKELNISIKNEHTKEKIIKVEKNDIDGENTLVKKYVLKNNKYFIDIYISKKVKEIYLGRFMYNTNTIVTTNNKFVLVYNFKFDNNIKSTVVDDISCLYDIDSEMQVVDTFDNLIEKYNSFSSEKLEYNKTNKSKLVYSTNIERKRRL